MKRPHMHRTKAAARLSAVNSLLPIPSNSNLNASTSTEEPQVAVVTAGVRLPMQAKSASPPIRIIPHAKKPPATFVERLDQFLTEARSFYASAPIVESSQFYSRLLDLAFELHRDHDVWIELCRHHLWNDDKKKRPKPSKVTEPVNWLIRFAGIELSIKRRSTVMRALNVLFDARYFGSRARDMLETFDLLKIAGIGSVSKDNQRLSALQKRWLLCRSTKDVSLSAEFPFVVLNFPTALREAVAEELRDADHGARFSIEFSVSKQTEGTSLRLLGFSGLDGEAGE